MHSNMLQLDALDSFFLTLTYCKASDGRGSEGGQRVQPRSMPMHTGRMENPKQQRDNQELL